MCLIAGIKLGERAVVMPWGLNLREKFSLRESGVFEAGLSVLKAGLFLSTCSPRTFQRFASSNFREGRKQMKAQ